MDGNDDDGVDLVPNCSCLMIEGQAVEVDKAANIASRLYRQTENFDFDGMRCFYCRSRWNLSDFQGIAPKGGKLMDSCSSWAMTDPKEQCVVGWNEATIVLWVGSPAEFGADIDEVQHWHSNCA